MRPLLSTIAAAMLALHAPASAETFSKAAVATEHPAASKAGAQMLEQGGNAVDAAVAAAFTLSVVSPYASGIGGGGFLVVTLPDDPRTDEPNDALRYALDFRETAPAAVGAEFYTGKPSTASREGALAVATPGAVAGLLKAHAELGALDRAAVLAPAIRAAEEGFHASADYAEKAEELASWFRAVPDRKETHTALFTDFIAEGSLEQGDTVKNPAQARALKLIAEEGPDAFYKGDIAAAIVAAIDANEGVLSAKDLERYAPAEREPLVSAFQGRTVVTMPPPSSGGVALLQTFALLERYEDDAGRTIADLGHNSINWIHALAEAFKHAFADRNATMGDPDHANVAWRELLDPDYLDTLASRTNPESALRPDAYGAPGVENAPLPDDAGTSHVSAADAAGGAASLTITINTAFGSKLLVEEYGFFLNSEMDDFTTRKGRPNAFGLKQSDANAPAPGKRPVSSMTPVILLDANGAPEVVAGASGGPRIITATAQAVLAAVVKDMTAQEAVDAPRLHHQLWPPSLCLEPEWDLSQSINPDDAEAVARWLQKNKRNERLRFQLTGMGHSLRRMVEIGAVQLLKRTDDGWDAAADPRKAGGAPAGVN